MIKIKAHFIIEDMLTEERKENFIRMMVTYLFEDKVSEEDNKYLKSLSMELVNKGGIVLLKQGGCALGWLAEIGKLIKVIVQGGMYKA